MAVTVLPGELESGKPIADSAPRECESHAAAIAIACFLMSGISIGQATYCFGMFVSPLADEYPSWSRVQINVALTVGQVVQSLVAPFGGMALDRFGCRSVVPLAALVSGSGWLLMSYTESLPVLYLSYALVYTGFPTNTMQQCGKVIGAWFPKSRGKVIGVVSAGNNVFGAILVQVTAALSWRDAALAFAIMQVCVALLYVLVVRNSRPIMPQQQAATEKASVQQEGALSATAEASPLRTWRFAAITLALSLCYFTYVAVLTQLPPALIADGVELAVATSCTSLVGIMGVSSKIVGGFLADKISAKRTMQLALLIQEAALVLLLLHGWLPRSSRWEGLAWVASGLYGAGFGAVGAMIPLITLEEYGVKIMGKASGFVGLSFLAPALVAPALAGASYDLTGQYTLSFAGVAGVFLAALFVLEALCRNPAVRDSSKPVVQPAQPSEEIGDPLSEATADQI